MYNRQWKDEIPELKNAIDEIMRYQYVSLSKSVRDHFTNQEAARVNLARNQFNQQIQNVKNNLLVKLNNYIAQRQNYVFLKLRQWFYGKVDTQQSYGAVFSKSASDLYSLANYEIALELINKINDYSSALSAHEKLQQLANKIQSRSSTLAYYIQEICDHILKLNKGLIVKNEFPQLNDTVNVAIQDKENEINAFISEYFNKQIEAVEGIPAEYIEYLKKVEKASEQLMGAEQELEKCPHKTYAVIYEEAYDDFDYGAWGNSDIQSEAEQTALAQQRYQKQEENYQAALAEASHRKILLNNAQLSARQYAEQKALPSHLIAACTQTPVILDDKAILQLLAGKSRYHQILEDIKIALNSLFGRLQSIMADHKTIETRVVASAPSAALLGLSQQKLFGTVPTLIPTNSQIQHHKLVPN